MMSEAFVKALRELADWYESHPDAPTPCAETINVFPDVSDLASGVRHCGGFKKVHADKWFFLTRDFGGIRLEFNFSRDEVCERIVIGKRVVPVQITPEHEEEIVEWKCHPLLKDDGI